MRFDRLDENTLIQMVAMSIVSYGMAIGLAFIAYRDGGL